jgi:hypothetical protein
VVDTGGSYKLLLTPEGVKKLGLEKAMQSAKPMGGGGYAGAQDVRLGEVPNLKVGAFLYRSMDTVFTSFGKESPFKIAQAGIGTFFLQDYTVTLDYEKKTLTLRK